MGREQLLGMNEQQAADVRDLEMFPRAYAIPSQWPTNVWQREAAEKTLDEFLSRFGDRILSPVATLSASKHLLQKTIPGNLPSPLANASRSIARQVLDLLQISFEDEDDPVEDDTAPRQVGHTSSLAMAA